MDWGSAGFNAAWWAALPITVVVSIGGSLSAPALLRWWENQPGRKRGKRVASLRRRVQAAEKSLGSYGSYSGMMLIWAFKIMPICMLGLGLLIVASSRDIGKTITGYADPFPMMTSYIQLFGFLIGTLSVMFSAVALKFVSGWADDIRRIDRLREELSSMEIERETQPSLA